MIPLELVTMGVSTVLSAVIKVWTQKSKDKADRELATIQALNAKAQIGKELLGITDKGVQWTRRIIALSVVFSVIVIPKIMILTGMYTGDYTFGWTELEGGFLFFTSPQEVLHWKTITNGLVITPLDTHTVSAIIGLYFGGSLSEARR